MRAYGTKVAPLNVDAANEEEIRLDLASESTNVAVARDAVAELALQVGADIDSVKIAVGEAVGNSVLHAYRGSDPGTIQVRAWIARGRLLVTIEDDGIGMRPNPDSQGLRLGVPLITTLCDDVRFTSSESGTFISMSFAAPGA
jgi:anti-sigma regulatory factor (Ser/Thr protein kinase)